MINVPESVRQPARGLEVASLGLLHCVVPGMADRVWLHSPGNRPRELASLLESMR